MLVKSSFSCYTNNTGSVVDIVVPFPMTSFCPLLYHIREASVKPETCFFNNQICDDGMFASGGGCKYNFLFNFSP